MAKTPYTDKYVRQYRGPSDSEIYNQRSEDIYSDLVYLHNKSNEIATSVAEGYSAVSKDLHGLSREIEDLKIELEAAKQSAGAKVISYTGQEDDDTDIFAGSAYEIADVDKLTLDSRFKITTLPVVVDSSVSRLRYAGLDGDVAVPPSLEMVVVPDNTSLDDGDPNTNVRTSLPYDAVVAEPGKVWERNIVSVNPSGQVTMDLMLKLPTELTATPYANVLELIPFPIYGVDILGVYYNLDAAPSLTVASGGWVPINDNNKYYNNTDAVGKVAPGAWSGDEALEAGPLSFVFPSKKVTAIKITLRQSSPFNVSKDYVYPKYLYSYGLSYLDVKYNKFETTGKVIYRLTPKSGDTISSVDAVTPYIYNVTQAGLDDVFSYRVIWETAPDSGVYTLTPVPSSEKAWLEVTLTKDSQDNLPALTGFKVEYT